MTNPWQMLREELTSPAFHHAAVTPHDSTLFATAARAIYVGTAGDVAIVSVNDEAVTYKNVPAGTIISVICKRVNATGTTATDIVAMW